MKHANKNLPNARNKGNVNEEQPRISAFDRQTKSISRWIIRHAGDFVRWVLQSRIGYVMPRLLFIEMIWLCGEPRWDIRRICAFQIAFSTLAGFVDAGTRWWSALPWVKVPARRTNGLRSSDKRFICDFLFRLELLHPVRRMRSKRFGPIETTKRRNERLTRREIFRENRRAAPRHKERGDGPNSKDFYFPALERIFDNYITRAEDSRGTGVCCEKCICSDAGNTGIAMWIIHEVFGGFCPVAGAAVILIVELCSWNSRSDANLLYLLPFEGLI